MIDSLLLAATRVTESATFSIPLYVDGERAWRQGVDAAGEIDEALGLNCAWYADILLTLTES